MVDKAAVFAGLSVEDAPEDAVKEAKTRVLLDDSNIIFKAFREAFDASKREGDWQGPTKRVQLAKADSLTVVESAIRQSARQLKCGAGTRYRTPAGKPVDIVSVDDKGKPIVKKEGEKRASKGKPTPHVDGKAYEGAVVVYFWPKYLRAKKSSKPATGTPAAPSGERPAPVAAGRR